VRAFAGWTVKHHQSNVFGAASHVFMATVALIVYGSPIQSADGGTAALILCFLISLGSPAAAADPLDLVLTAQRGSGGSRGRAAVRSSLEHGRREQRRHHLGERCPRADSSGRSPLTGSTCADEERRIRPRQVRAPRVAVAQVVRMLIRALCPAGSTAS
jgi:hypothetical protein